MRVSIACGIGCLLFLTACNGAKLPMTQLQVRQIQTRTYDIRQPRRAVKAVLNVLQDEGFIPRQVAADVGFIYAAKEMDLEDPKERFWAKFWKGRDDARWRKNSLIECAVNVTELRDGMRVRINFQVKIYDNAGQIVTVETIDDPLFYQDFFSRIDKGIFLEKSGL